MNQIIEDLRVSVRNFPEPVSFTIIEKFGRDAYLILISCIISLRTKDSITLAASLRLFCYAKTPQKMLILSQEVIQKALYPAGFYKRKAAQIKEISDILVQKYNGIVPQDESELLALPGVGRKTAELVRGLAFGIPSLCVDVHVHRIANRLGWVNTKTPEETEYALKNIISKEYWIELNRLLVMWGQNVCVSKSPFCSICTISQWCRKINVTRCR